MNERLSHKLKWMSFVATWAVVCIHSRTDRWAPAADDWARSTQSVVADMFHFAVPLFFAISGFFFVQSFEKYGWAKLLRRKIRVLYVPFVIWATLAVLLLLPIRLYSGADIPDWLSFAGIPLMWTEKCQSVHFWYVRALLIFFILSPIVMFVVRRTWLAALLMLFTLLVPTGSWAASKHIPVALFFFLGGALVGKSEKRFSYVLRVRRGAILLISVLLFGVSFVLKQWGWLSAHYFSILVQPILAIGFLWLAYDWIDSRFGIPHYPNELNVMFFVYCLHLIVLSWVGGVMRIAVGAGPVARLCGYFLLWQTFWIDVLLANLVRKCLPKVYGVLSGGR